MAKVQGILLNIFLPACMNRGNVRTQENGIAVFVDYEKAYVLQPKTFVQFGFPCFD